MSQKYTEAGVNIDEADKVVTGIRGAVESTWNNNVVSNFGDFAGLFAIDNSILASSVDGVGTKTIATIQTLGTEGFYYLGQDIVNHCVNDILVKGAKPLFFLDYIASAKLDSKCVVRFVEGVAEACKEANCALLGGETAEMPGVYHDNHVDIVGTIVGMVEPNRIIDGSKNIKIGDYVVGLCSNGAHTNGYSLIRKVLPTLTLQDVQPHRSYLPDIRKIYKRGIDIKGLCHITGGGYWGNIKRVLPKFTAVKLDIPRPSLDSIFTKVQQAGEISDEEMLTVFNMGFGMLIFVNEQDAIKILDVMPSGYAHILGTVIDSDEPNISLS